MKNFQRFSFLLILSVWFFPFSAYCQELNDIGIANSTGLDIDRISLSDSNSIAFHHTKPLFSFRLDNRLFNSHEAGALKNNGIYNQVYGNNLGVTYKVSGRYNSGLISELTFENKSVDTLSISNVIPFGQDTNSVYITGRRPWDVACAWLFRPGYNAVRVILPDNAWELGYSSFEAGENYSVCALARRTAVEGAQKKRYETILPPKARVTYTIHTEVFKGEWQNGLRKLFRDRYLFDLENFDNSLFNRKDLTWIKESYLIILQMAWDREFYDRFTGKYTYPEMLRKDLDIFGKVDVFGIWPTWPRLGLDERNQWDLYRDLPGGTGQLKNLARLSRISGTRFFIAYNPWDNSTRTEDHYRGMAQIISETDADGVVLDTRGSSSYQLQAAADSVKKGVIMYSEGMAIPKDMPGIISGRVHNAIFMSPELNLNKLIKPDFSIFRVCDVGEDIIHREIAIAFFNGYGTELNLFRPGGRDENYTNDLRYLAKTTFILRQNNDAFLDMDWTPMIETLIDNVFVNRWSSGEKTVYTILNMRPEGINAKLIKIDTTRGTHFVSLWNHENIKPVVERGRTYLAANTSGWQSSFSGTRKEGSLDCIARLPDLIKSKIVGDSIIISGKGIRDLLIWKGEPSNQTLFREYHLLSDTALRVKDIFGIYEGKIVLQYIENKRLRDENVLFMKGGKPWLISRITRTDRASSLPSDMALVPGANFSFSVSTNEDFFPYPDVNGYTTKIDSFLVDKYPVTNEQYYNFVTSTGYRPADTTRYLRLWESGTFRPGQEKYPVTYISLEDMLAYSKWAKKRLPTQAEWQLAAQGTDKRPWPWGNEFHGTYCNSAFDKITPVDAFPKGQSPYGVFDLVGNVWQMTNDLYFNGVNYFSVIRGGSYYKPESSWWYIQGGPQSLDRTQILLLVSPGYDRSATVGFRCVKDVESKNFKVKSKK
jgi:gamma-glutamyl hercynylcysteine S-oxide synthase